MTKDGSSKQVVRRHARETGQRYTAALTDLEDLETRLFHEPDAERLVAHLRDRYGIDAVAATKLSQHNDRVFRVDRRDGEPWIARVFPPARPGPASKVTPRSCGSWSAMATRQNVSPSTMRCRRSTGRSSSSPGSSMATRCRTAPRSWP